MARSSAAPMAFEKGEGGWAVQMNRESSEDPHTEDLQDLNYTDDEGRIYPRPAPKCQPGKGSNIPQKPTTPDDEVEEQEDLYFTDDNGRICRRTEPKSASGRGEKSREDGYDDRSDGRGVQQGNKGEEETERQDLELENRRRGGGG